MEFAIGVVELLLAAVSCCQRILETDLGAAVVQTHCLWIHVCLERSSLGSDAIYVERITVAAELYAEFHRISVLAGLEAVGLTIRHPLFGASEYRILAQVLGLQGCGISLDTHITAEVAAAQDYLSVFDGQCAAHGHIYLGARGIGRQLGREYLQTGSGRDGDILGKIGRIDLETLACPRPVDHKTLGCLGRTVDGYRRLVSERHHRRGRGQADRSRQGQSRQQDFAILSFHECYY